MIDKNAPKNQESISLVDPAILALRLAYLISTNQEKGIFFRTTRKRLEKFAEDKTMLSNGEVAIERDKAPITEAYIAITRYELEKLGIMLVRVDKEYLLSAAESLKRVSILKSDEQALTTLDNSTMQAEVKKFFAKENKPSIDEDNKKPVTDDKWLILKDIWSKLVEHARVEISTEQPERLCLTYEQLVNKLMYKIHRNGLTSHLYSIEQYCIDNRLPKLNYLVVKEKTGLPDGLKNINIESVGLFNNELKEIIEFIKDGLFSTPSNIKYQKKERPKKSKQLASKEIFTELDS